jgi:hypothetical protein
MGSLVRSHKTGLDPLPQRNRTCELRRAFWPLRGQVVEFLHRIVDIFKEYFGGIDDVSIKENFSTVYQVRPLTRPCMPQQVIPGMAARCR